uniref:Uncharacterized protein AlNc14C116G6552 n=1 Tax=Albugo laibachii Nc14 TaxID=890382 RepID=F0WJ21_9STRA|nr:conserved hypothetical protein [Albugo laibachii Nc14]|eukprot:CCA21267.1 conserved hypothetical protein [Albugo laibachii Nc14]
MKLTTVPGLPAPPAPEVVAKTDKCISLRVNKASGTDEFLKFQVGYSEHGYVYYSWSESKTFNSMLYVVEGLLPNTTYVFRARSVDTKMDLCSEWSSLTPYVRTFTEEEDVKRSGTYYEHALRMEKEKKEMLQAQITKLTSILNGPSRQNTEEEMRGKVKCHENMLSSRRIMDTSIQKLQSELKDQACALAALKNQRSRDEKVISDLLNEQEHLQKIKNAESTNDAKHVEEMKLLREKLNQNELALCKHREQITISAAKISEYEDFLQEKQSKITQKEQEVERLMADCNRMVQEQADVAHAKRIELEDALIEAKASLEQQLDINTYLREEVTRFREENRHLKNQIDEMDSKIAPKLVALEEENWELRQSHVKTIELFRHSVRGSEMNDGTFWKTTSS